MCPFPPKQRGISLSSDEMHVPQNLTVVAKTGVATMFYVVETRKLPIGQPISPNFIRAERRGLPLGCVFHRVYKGDTYFSC